MTRTEYLDDPDAPRPNSLVPAASAVVVDEQGRVLLARRTDNDLWTIPGGAMEPGESIASTATRETLEETGIAIAITGLVGIYSNPGHVIAYSDGEVRQEFSVCFVARPVGGSATASSETSQVRFVEPDELDDLEISPSIRLRIHHGLEPPPQPYWG